MKVLIIYIMKRLIFLFAVVILAVSVSCERDSGSSSDVAVSISPNTLTVPSAGGTFSISYLFDENQNVELEPVCGETWIGGWDFSVDGVLTFQVDTNRGGARTAVVHLVSDRLAEDVFFTVEQGDASKVYMYDLENAVWTARICKFDREETIFQEVNPEVQSELWSSYITAGEYADQYAQDWNLDHPDDLISSEDALGFEFTDPEAVNPEMRTFFTVTFNDGCIEVVDGMETVAGAATVIRIAGKFTFDEETGIMTVADTCNTLYDREVRIQFSKENEEMVYDVVYMWHPDYLTDYFGTSDRLGFVLANYDGSKCYIPHGKLRYYLRYLEPYYDEEQQ